MNGLFARLARVVALMRDPRVGKLPRFAVVAAILYLLWPADLVPELVTPLLGFLDDATLLWLSMRWLLNRGKEPVRPLS